MGQHGVNEVDPFDLPEWLGEAEVRWDAETTIRGSSHLRGALSSGLGSGLGSGSGATEAPVPCDMLAIDLAYPRPTVSEEWRRLAHQQWVHGQVLLVEYDGRLTLAVPGSGFDADRALEALSRFARAVGAKPERFVAALRL